MKRINFIIAVLITGLFPVFSTSCEKEGGENETNISNTNTTSHHAGDNCMSCHKSGGSGEGWFQVAGTAYNSSGTSPYANATLKLYRNANVTGESVLTVVADKSGNFYSTSSINFGSGLFVSIANTNGTLISMNSPVTSGACNSCHSSGSRIVIP